MPTALISVRDICRRDINSNRVLLNQIRLDVMSGQRIGLIGPTGSGKSTLLRAIAMLDRLQSGQVSFCNREIHGDDVPAYRRQVILLPQRTTLIAGTVRKNLQLPFGFHTATAVYQEDHAAELLDRVCGSSRLLDHQVASLSGGEQQIVALVRAVSLQPCVLLLDEPTTGLDPESTQRVEQLVLQWHRNELPVVEVGEAHNFDERALVWTSHDEGQIRRMTNRIVSMRDGALAEESNV